VAERARLFSALVPPEDVLVAVRRALRDAGVSARSPELLRWTSVEQWHVTLGFYGHDEPEARAEWLRTRLAGLPSPTVRVEGSGSFPGVLWLGLRGRGLAEVAQAARTDTEERPYVAHLTLALARRRRGPRAQQRRVQATIDHCRRSLAQVTTPEWDVSEIVLMRSDPAPEPGVGPHYRVVRRFPLDAPW
jgi:2'-5' RNA ligase